jgi:hypothetical protein
MLTQLKLVSIFVQRVIMTEKERILKIADAKKVFCVSAECRITSRTKYRFCDTIKSMENSHVHKENRD